MTPPLDAPDHDRPPEGGLQSAVGRISTAALAALGVFAIELAYCALHRVPSVELTIDLWVKLALQAAAFVVPLAAGIAAFLAARDGLARAFGRTWLGRSSWIGDLLQAVSLATLASLVLLATEPPPSASQSALRILGAATFGATLFALRWLLQRGGEDAARSNITSLATLAFVLWLLNEGNIGNDLALRKFGFGDSIARNATIVTCAMPFTLMLSSPALRWAGRIAAHNAWTRRLAGATALVVLALLQHVNFTAFPDSYAYYHRVLLLLACMFALWLARLIIDARMLERLRTTLPRRTLAIVAVVGLLLPATTLRPWPGSVEYVAAIHTVWLRFAYDMTGPARSRLSAAGVAPASTTVAIGTGNEVVPYERRPRDVVLFLLDGQRLDGYSLHGPLAAHMPRTVRCFEGAFELRRAFTAGTSTEIAYPAFHSSTFGNSRDQVRGRDLATDEWLAAADHVTSLSEGMSSSGHRTVLASDSWYLDVFFDPPKWSPIFGRYDEVVRPRKRQSLADAWDPSVLGRKDGKPLFLVVHIFNHGLEARPQIDALVGTICDDLAAHGRLGDAALLLTADHGWQNYEHGRGTYGRTLFNEEALVPLYVRLPGLSGGARDFNVSFVDHLPTLLDLQGSPIPPSAEGQSYLPLLLGQEPNRARPIFMETRMPVWGSTAVVRGDFKLIRWATPGIEAMFDLRSDPGETRSILDAPGMESQTAELRGWLAAFLAR
jgi:hypothetical protein